MRLRREGRNMMQREGLKILWNSMKFFVSSFGLNNGTSFARTYLFDLDFNRGDQNLYTVDAAFYGNLSHFINHRFIQIILKLSYLFILQL